MRAAFGLLRFALAAVTGVAIVSRYLWGRGSLFGSADNFFAYLTVQSNLWFAALAIVAGACALRRTSDPRWLTTARAAALTGTLSSGIVFALITQQANVRGFAIYVPWSDVAMHYVIPVLALAEWILSPGRDRSAWRAVVIAVGYVVLWGVFTLIRGAIVGWYPYYFLDPDQVSGVLELAVYCAIALAFFGAVGTGVVVLSRRIRRGQSVGRNGASAA